MTIMELKQAIADLPDNLQVVFEFTFDGTETRSIPCDSVTMLQGFSAYYAGYSDHFRTQEALDEWMSKWARGRTKRDEGWTEAVKLYINKQEV